MTVAPGMRLGPYEVQSAIGAGGMGEVYKARDGRLNREVALKILPREFAEDAGRRGRFEREAKAAAALNHPNILGLYDVGEQDGVMYMITELVPGETLSATIARGPVPVKKLLDIAAQIADGMSCAHAAGIAHRDLKPANIMVTPEGRVKILDFGLARQTERSASDGWGETATRTHPGMILGTVNYMSPEQARGLPADHRSDQFSFGLILYEMVTGRKAFDKPEPLAGMLAIMSDEAPPIDRPIPTPLRWTIERCLEKEPAWAAKQPVLAHVTDRNGQPEIWVRSGNVDRPLVTAGDFAPGTTGRLNGPALSPEGDRVIYTRFGAGSDSSMRLWISALSGGAPVPLTNDASVE